MNRVRRHSGRTSLLAVLAVNTLLASGLIQSFHTCAELTFGPVSSSRADLRPSTSRDSVEKVHADCVVCHVSSHARGLIPQHSCLDVRPSYSAWQPGFDPPLLTVEVPTIIRPRAPPAC